MDKRILTILIIVIGFVMGFVLSANFARAGCVSEHYDFHCGDIVNESCVMNLDLNSSGTCFHIITNNTFVDCNQHSIHLQTPNPYLYGIMSLFNENITITNCKIDNFWDAGILLDHVTKGAIINNTVFNNRGIGILLTASSEILVERNNVSYNGFSGMRLDMSSYNDSIINNLAEGNHIHGIVLIEGIQNTTVVNNTARNNHQAGILLQSASVNNYVANNDLSRNWLYGLAIFYNADNNTLLKNKIDSSGQYGVYISSSKNNIFVDSIIFNSSLGDVYSCDEMNGEVYNTLLNVSFNKDKVNVTNGTIYVKWYLDVYVQEVNGTPINNAQVTLIDMFNNRQDFFTGQDGTIPRSIVEEYSQDSQGKSYTNFYHIIVRKFGFYSVSKYLHVFGNEFVSATLRRIARPPPVKADSID